MSQDIVIDFINYAKEHYGLTVSVNPKEKSYTFDELFGEVLLYNPMSLSEFFQLLHSVISVYYSEPDYMTLLELTYNEIYSKATTRGVYVA